MPAKAGVIEDSRYIHTALSSMPWLDWPELVKQAG